MSENDDNDYDEFDESSDTGMPEVYYQYPEEYEGYEDEEFGSWTVDEESTAHDEPRMEWDDLIDRVISLRSEQAKLCERKEEAIDMLTILFENGLVSHLPWLQCRRCQ